MALAQNLSFILLGEDRNASKTMDAAAAKAEQTTGRIGSAFSKVGGVLGGEFGNVLSQVGNGIDNMGAKAAKLSTGLMIGGGVATVAGVALLKMGSDYKQSSDQLDQASKTAGDSVSAFSGKIETAVQKAENFDHSAVDTKNALAKLTEATGSTQKALDQMQVVTDLAAAKHISLSDAATMVTRILSGSGARTLTQYGIVMQKAVDPTKALAAAHALVQTSSDKLAAAQKRLTDLEEIDHAKKKLTVADHIALQNAQDAVTKASGVLDAAQTKLNNTSDKTITKQQAGAAALDQLAKKLNGQGTASVNNFGSQVDIMRTKIQDWVDQVSGPVGSVLAGLGPLFTIAGVAVDIYRAKKEAATLAEIASASATTAATTATEGETAATVALDGAMDVNPIIAVGAALVGLAAVAGGIGISSVSNLTLATHDYTAALQASNGVIDDNVKKQAAQALESDGAFKAASKLGIAHSLVLSATLGDKNAQAELTVELEKVKSSISSSSGPAALQQRQLESLTGSAGATRDAMTLLGNAVDGESGAMSSQVHSINDVNDALNRLSATASRGVAASASRYAGQAAAYATSRHASGGDIMSPQMSLVGENGPEVVALPGGSHVYPTGQGPSSSGGGIQVTVVAPPGAYFGSANDMGKAMATNLINVLRGGGVSKTELRAALGL